MRRSSFDISILLLLVLLLLCHAATIYAARLPSSTGLKKRLDTYGCPGNYSLVATEQPVYITDNADSSSPSHTYANNMECQWSISALDPSKIIQLTFSHFDLECGYDYLTIYDGESNNVLAKLCGNRTSMNDTVFSDSSSMKIVLQTDATTVRSGFLGTYQAIDRCNACQSIGHGTCNVDNSTCECDPGYFGTACEKPGQNDTMFTARYYHSAVYYPPRDSMIVYGGTTMNGMPTPELLEFHFSNMSWTEPMVASTIKPTPRYGHTLFVYNNSVYCFGGSNRIGIVMNDLWKLDPDGWNWTEIQYANSAPPILIDPSVTIATLKNDSTRIFLFGGYSIQTALPGAMSRDLYAYDLDANIWYEGYRQNSVGLINAAGIYHSERDSLFYFGGIRSDGSTNVYEYHLPSDLWFIGEQQPLFQGRVQGTYADVGNGSNYLFVGGEMPYQNYTGYQSNQCYFGDILLYDLACGTMNMQRNIPLSGSPEQHLVPRKGHSMVVRDDVAWILGGHNGFDLADMISFPLPKDNLNSSQAAQCKALRWCGNYNDCQDCLQRSHCSYCNNMCLYDTAKAGTSLSLDGTCQSLEAAQVSSSSCPSREILNLNDTFEGSVEFGSVLTFKTFVDAPKSDIVFSISPANNSIQLFFQTLNVWQGNINNQISPIIFDKDGNIQREIYSSTGIEYQSFNASQLYDDANPLTGTSPTVILRADDWRRFSGYYVYRVSADPELLDTSMFQSTINSTNAQAKNNSRVVFTLTVDTVAKDASSSDSASDGNPAGDSLKIAAVVLLAVSVVMFGAITLYMLRRMRRYANARETLAYDMQDFGSIPDLTVSNSAGVYRAKVKTLPLQPKQDDIQPENMAALTITDNLQPLSVHPYKSDESTVSEARINNSSTAALYAVHYVLVLPTPPPPPPPADRPSTPQESLRPSSNTSSASVTPSEEHTRNYLPAIALGCALTQVKPDTQNDTTSEPGPSCNNQGRS